MIEGLVYIPDFISEGEQVSLVSTIDQQPWLSDLKRRTQHYGYKYDYTKKVSDKSLYLGPIPDWLTPYCHKLLAFHFRNLPDQVIINEYLPGQGISRHVDCLKCFGDTIASLSLSSTCAMEFERIKSSERGSTVLGPRSLLVLSGEARSQWMHSIPARKSDEMGELVLPRSRRISLTFRTMIL